MHQSCLRNVHFLLSYSIAMLWSMTAALTFSSCDESSSSTGLMAGMEEVVARYDSLSEVAPDLADSLAWAEAARYGSGDDSVFYYTMMQSRISSVLSHMEMDKADSIVALVADFCGRTKPTTHAAYRLRYDNANGRALVAYLSGDMVRAATYFEIARDEAYRYGLSECYYNASINVADVYITCHRLPEAAAVLRRGLFLCDSLRMGAALKVPFFNALSMIYIRLGDYASALRYSDDAYSIIGGASVFDRFNFWNTRGNVYYFRHYYAKAGACFDSCLQIFDEEQLPESHRHIALLNRQDIAIRLGEYSDTIDHTLRACEDFFTQTGNASGCSYVATLQGQLAMARDGDYATAGRLLGTPIGDDIEASVAVMRRDALRDYYLATDMKDSVIAIDRIILARKDSLLNDVAAMRVADVELQYKESIRAVEFAAQRHDLESRLYIALLLALVLALMIGIILTINHIFRKRKDLEFARLSGSLMQEKIRNMRSRLSPHFLMNMAKMLDTGTAAEEVADAPSSAESIAMMLRESLEIGSRIAVGLDEEVAFVKKCLAVLPRMKEIGCEWHIDPAVDTSALHIPSMAIQLPIENAVKYAFPPEAAIANPTITVTARPAIDAQRAAGVEVIIEDNGVGMKRTAFSPHSNGYAILTRTISCFNMRNAHAIDMKIHNKTGGDGSGVRVTFFFPYDYKYDL